MHWKMRVNYYPFGLTMSAISTVAPLRLEGKRKFNGIEFNHKEFSDGSGLELYTAKFRGLDPQIGRWWQIDPKPNYAITPYAAMNLNPILHADFLGDTVIVNQVGDITRNDKTDNLVFMTGSKKEKLIPLGALGKKIDANTIYKNLAKRDAKEAKRIWNPLTFKKYVKTGGKWDLKNNKNSIFGLGNDGKTKFLFQGKEMGSQDIGNHHFGVVGEAYGLFSEEFMLKEAGQYQIKSGTSRPEWQRYRIWTQKIIIEHGIPSTITHKEMLPPYGDDPTDQEWIKAGFQYYKDMEEEQP